MNCSTNTDKQKLILDAAQYRFAHYGLGKVTMDEIATDLGISKASLYYYFETKEEIFRQVIAREQDVFINKIEAILKRKSSASEKLLEYFHQHVLLLDKLLNLKIISLQADNVLHPIIRELFKTFSTKELVFLGSILSDGKIQNEFSMESPEKTASLLQHVLLGLRLRFFKTVKNRDIGEMEVKSLAHEIKLFSKIFLRGISH